jgi:hypothetical protein
MILSSLVQNTSGHTDFERPVMNSHNAKTGYVFHKTVTVTDDSRKKAEIVSNSLINDAGLSIVDDDSGCDPYNSTGQHVVIKSKLPLED